MPDPITASIVGGGALIGGIAQNEGNRRAANAQRDAASENNALAREQFNRTERRLDPYNQLGVNAVQGLGDFLDPAKRAQMMDQYSKSAEFQQLSDQARNQQLAAGEATGGLGGTAMQNSLATIAPQLQQNYMDQMLNNRLNFAKIGLGAATQTGAAGENYVTNTSMNNNNAAEAMARYRQNQGGLISDTLGGITGNYAGGKVRGFF